MHLQLLQQALDAHSTLGEMSSDLCRLADTVIFV